MEEIWSYMQLVFAAVDGCLDEQPEEITEYSESITRRLIKKVTVYDEKLVVEFKSGTKVEIEA